MPASVTLGLCCILCCILCAKRRRDSSTVSHITPAAWRLAADSNYHDVLIPNQYSAAVAAKTHTNTQSLALSSFFSVLMLKTRLVCSPIYLTIFSALNHCSLPIIGRSEFDHRSKGCELACYFPFRKLRSVACTLNSIRSVTVWNHPVQPRRVDRPTPLPTEANCSPANNRHQQ